MVEREHVHAVGLAHFHHERQFVALALGVEQIGKYTQYTRIFVVESEVACAVERLVVQIGECHFPSLVGTIRVAHGWGNVETALYGPRRSLRLVNTINLYGAALPPLREEVVLIIAEQAIVVTAIGIAKGHFGVLHGDVCLFTILGGDGQPSVRQISANSVMALKNECRVAAYHVAHSSF